MAAKNAANGTLDLPGLEPPKLTGTVHKVVHADIGRGFYILRVKTEDGIATVTGRGDAVTVGDAVSAEGRWEVHAKYGRQFKAKFITADVPESAEGVAKYLGGGAIRGIGPRTADALLTHFGDQLPAALESPTILQAAGIAERKAKAISEHWTLRSRYTQLISLLLSHGIGPATAKRIIDHYGDDTMRVVTTQPYRLAEDVHGIGFKKADHIALSQRLPREAPERVRAGLMHQIQSLQRDGHCAAPRDIIRQEASKLLTVRDGAIDQGIDKLLEDGSFVEDLIGQRPVIYDARMRQREIAVADMIMEHVQRDFDLTRAVPDIEALIDRAAASVEIALHDNQARAVRISLKSGFSVITGGPGTGKTSTLRTFIAAYELIMAGEARVLLAAPTGRAAKRMTEATGRDATTIHRLLGWTANANDRQNRRGENRKIDATALIIDESSMKDLMLIHELMKALPETCRLILVGDADQLPSVGPGNVLADIVDSGAVPVARLTRIWRQSDGSLIATAARQINDAQLPQMTEPRRSSDMWKVVTREPDEAADKIVRLVTEVLPDLGWDPLSQVQVLTPGHAHDTGTTALNQRIQEALNPASPTTAEIHHNNRVFRVGDRVIQVTNNYDLEVFNGDIGNVTAVQGAGDDQVLVVDFDGHQAIYRRSEVDELQLAYATTIHKSQGSEFPVVIVALTTQHFVMLRRNLIYTAVTRARKLCVVVGQEQAMAIAVRRDGGRRITGLAARLAGRALTADALARAPASVPTDALEGEY